MLMCDLELGPKSLVKLKNKSQGNLCMCIHDYLKTPIFFNSIVLIQEYFCILYESSFYLALCIIIYL